jgi:hypothetical protein
VCARISANDLPDRLIDYLPSLLNQPIQLLRDKVLLILSEHSIKSDWVEDEVTTAFEEERKRGGQPVLFPIRLGAATSFEPPIL